MFIYLNVFSIPEQPEVDAKGRIRALIQPPGNIKAADSVRDWHAGVGKYVGVKDKLVETEYLKTAYDGLHGQISTISFQLEGEKIIHLTDGVLDEKGVLVSFFSYVMQNAINKLDHDNLPLLFVGHYLQPTLRLIFQRALVLGVKLPFDLKQDGKAGIDFLDTMVEWCGYRDQISLETLYYGLIKDEGGDTLSMDEVWPKIKEKNYDAVRDYGDFRITAIRTIAERMLGESI